MTKNRTAGHGQNSHEIPTAEGQVVLIKDGHHRGTSVWRSERSDDSRFVFACHERDAVGYAPRCVLLAGQDVEMLPGGWPYGCDLSSPRGLILLGVGADDDLSWLGDDAEVLWDSTADEGSATNEPHAPPSMSRRT